MKVKSGSDWLLSQEKLARRKIAELQRVPPSRTVTETGSRSIQGSGDAGTLKLILKLVFILCVLLLVISVVSFLAFFIFPPEGSLKAVMEVLALPIAFPLLSLMGGDFGENTDFYRSIASGGWGIFLITLLLSYFLGYAPDKVKKEKVTRKVGETSAQKRQREKTLAEWQEKLKNVQAGHEAEERTSHLLGSLLNDNWTLYRNVTLSDGRNDDIDAVLVGPSGVYVLEIKAYSGLHRYSTTRWEVAMGGGRWQAKEWNPARQAADGQKRLMSFLGSQGLGHIKVEPRVVWAGEGRVEVVGQPPVLFWFLSSPNIASFLKKDLWRGATRLRANDLANLDKAFSWLLQ